jgi:hypothetical protein
MSGFKNGGDSDGFVPLGKTSKSQSFAVQPFGGPKPEHEPHTLYPHIEPFKTGFLGVGDGHEIFYECSGNPDGEPAMFLHGGPGGGCGVHTRQFFDPAFYMVPPYRCSPFNLSGT